MSNILDEIPVVNKTGEILKDEKVDWTALKLQALAIACAMIGFTNRQKRMYDCGSYLEFLVLEHGVKHLVKAIFCRDRLCPACQKRRSLALFHDVREICLSILFEKPTTRFVFLTLTVPNVKSDKLSDEISHLFKSYQSLKLKAKFKKGVVGFFRALEVTYNKTRGDYHPHIHVLLAVKPSYFTRYYISQAEWLNMWQLSTGNDLITQVDVRAVKNDRVDAADISDVVAEVAKYTVKPSSYLKPVDAKCRFFADRAVVQTLAVALKSKRLIGYGGVFKVHKAKLEAEGKDERNVQEELLNEALNGPQMETITRQLFKWNAGLSDYVDFG